MPIVNNGGDTYQPKGMWSAFLARHRPQAMDVGPDQASIDCEALAADLRIGVEKGPLIPVV